MDQLFPSGVGPMLAENASATRFPERSPRVALVCDLFEENWPSMDLVAEMLFQHLLSHHSTEFRTTSLRPAMRRRFTRLPLLCEGRFAFNSDRLLNRFFDYPRWFNTKDLISICFTSSITAILIWRVSFFLPAQ